MPKTRDSIMVLVPSGFIWLILIPLLFIHIPILVSIQKKLRLQSYIFIRRQTTYHTVMGGSSIILLQERFRQLQRAREQREKRELKLFYDPPPHQLMPPVFQQKTNLSSEAVDQEAISLGLTLSTNKPEFQAFNNQHSNNNNSNPYGTLCKIENYDIDTSLRL